MGHQFEELSSRVLEAAVAVHTELGPGFVEPIYQKAMEVALQHRAISFHRQKEVALFFEDEYLGFHKLDLVVADEIVLELKAVKGSKTFTTRNFASTSRRPSCTSVCS
jgi:GxxExxY protein